MLSHILYYANAFNFDRSNILFSIVKSNDSCHFKDEKRDRGNEFADNNLKFYKNGRKFSKQVDNTVGKGEIACYEQSLLFLQCFQKTCTTDM